MAAQKLHADVDPIYFSPNFKPMVKLVEILSAEARRAKEMDTKQAKEAGENLNGNGKRKFVAAGGEEGNAEEKKKDEALDSLLS